MESFVTSVSEVPAARCERLALSAWLSECSRCVIECVTEPSFSFPSAGARRR